MRLLLLVFMLVLVACAPISQERFVTFTPGASTPTSESATWTPAPDNSLWYLPMNNNHELLNSEVTRLLPDPDGIYRAVQCVPAGMGVEIIYHQPESVRTPFWIHCDVDNADGGVQRVDIGNRDGMVLWRIPFLWFDADQCYLAKITGYSQIVVMAGGSMDSIAVTMRLEPTDSSGIHEFTRQPIPGYGSFERVWSFWSVDDSAPAVEIGLVVDYGLFGGRVDVDRIEVMRVPDGYCDGVDSW